MPERDDFPPPLRADLDSPPLDRKGWQATTSPYIALFLWMVFFDQLGRRTLAIGGLGWSVLGAGVGGLLCYLLLYRVPALWGQQTGRPLTIVGSSTFGVTGSVGLMIFVFGLAQVLVMAVSTFYAVEWGFQGLTLSGLVNVKTLRPTVIHLGGSRTFELASALVLATSMFWIYAAALTGHYLVKIIAALMKIYPVYPAIMLALATLLTFGGLPDFRPLELDPATEAPVVAGGPRAFLMMIQMFLGFFAMAGVGSADWGAASRSPRDVRLAGWVGVVFASWTVATLALLTVAGSVGRYSAPLMLKNVPGVGNFSVRVALVLALPPLLAASMFLVFALASLAQTCYASSVFARRLEVAVPRVSRIAWTLIGATAAWPIVAAGVAIRLEEIFTLLGAVFAPMVGAMTADYVRNRGVWPGPRRGVNPAGLIAWVSGLAVGLLPLIASAGGWNAAPLQPASLYAFGTSFLTCLLLSMLGVESTKLPLPEVQAEPESSSALVATESTV